MKLLLIEDSKLLAESLYKALGKSFVIEIRRTGKEGEEAALTEYFDVIVLDLGLPDKSGYDICKSIREAGLKTPILILTAAADIPSRVALLNAGADDYVVKPFHIDELRARLNALSRRSPEEYSSGIMNINDLTVDPGRRRVERAGVRIALRRKEFDILECLIRNKGRPVTRSMLLDYAWDGSKEAWNNTVDVHIKHLRDKIDRPFGPPIIKTAYGIGYMIDDM